MNMYSEDYFDFTPLPLFFNFFFFIFTCHKAPCIVHQNVRRSEAASDRVAEDSVRVCALQR